MKKAVISIVTLLVIMAVVAGSFWAGMSFGEARANQARERLFRERFGGQGGQAPGLFRTPQPGQGGAERFAGGIMGTVEAVEGDALIVTTQEGDISVRTTDTTIIEKYTTVAIGDLEAGERVVVSGTRDDDGSYTARSIRVLQVAPAPQSR
jgi:hypothetical protein